MLFAYMPSVFELAMALLIGYATYRWYKAR